MSLILLEQTRTTPYVFLDPAMGVFEMKGRSLQEPSAAFYNPIIQTIEENCAIMGNTLTVNFAFEHFSSSSYNCVHDVLSKLSQIEKNGKEVTVNWFYDEDDEDMLEVGEDYQSISDMKFNFIPNMC